MNIVLIIVLIVLGLLILGFLIVCAVMAHFACGRNDTMENHCEQVLDTFVYRDYKEQILAARDWLQTQNTEAVSVVSRDGLKLAGLFLPCENARGTLLCFHGWRGGPIADFGYSVRLYRELGLNVLLVHQRAQGKSEGKHMTFGVLERRDVHTWVRWHTERFGRDLPILLAGISMGATTVLMACGEPFDGNVRGAVADCGFTSPKEICMSVSRSIHLPPKLFVPVVGLFVRMTAGFGLNDYSTLTAMEKATMPVLFVHGEADAFVPCEMTKRNYAACASADKTLLLIPDAKHGQSMPVAPERYTEAVRAFLDRTVGKNKES